MKSQRRRQRSLAISRSLSLSRWLVRSFADSLSRSSAVSLSTALDLLLSCSPALPLRLSRSLPLLLSRWLARALDFSLSLSLSLSRWCVRSFAASPSRNLVLSLFLSFLLTRSRAEAVKLDRSSARSPACSLAVSHSGRLAQCFVCKLARVFVFSLVRSPLSLAVALSLSYFLSPPPPHKT